jgi:hypothetical protein
VTAKEVIKVLTEGDGAPGYDIPERDHFKVSVEFYGVPTTVEVVASGEEDAIDRAIRRMAKIRWPGLSSRELGRKISSAHDWVHEMARVKNMSVINQNSNEYHSTNHRFKAA